MNSLRLVLGAWLLALLAGLQAGVGLLAYSNARLVVMEKNVTAEELELSRTEDRKHEEMEHMDRQLLDHALILARLMQVHLNWNRIRYRELNTLGVVSLATAPQGFVLFPGWISTQFRGPLYSEVLRQVPEIRFDRSELEEQLNDVTGYYQVDTVWGSSFRSGSLNQDGMALDVRTFAPDQVLYFEFNDYELPSGIKVRRVRLKAPSSRSVPTAQSFNPPRPRLQGGGGNRGGPPAPGPAAGPGGPDQGSGSIRSDAMPLRPSVFIQCAYPLDLRDRMVAELDRKLELRRDELHEERDGSLNHLAWQLGLISTATFLVGAVGTGILVRWGLSPLRRLSEAVSQVTERDFRLQLDKESLPEELKPISERIDSMLGQLGRAFQREKQATADISHELRTPLAAILTTLELALRKNRTEQQYREFMTDCHDSASHMARIVEKLLALARLDAGTAMLKIRQLDLAEVLDQCLEVVAPLAKKESIQLVHEGDTPCRIHSDSEKLRETILNLLHNAIQYNRRGGTVTVRQFQQGNDFILEVQDTGVGIPAEAREMIFERFYRHDPSRHNDGSNAGLGLAIVHSFVLLMGGTIGVESTVGVGTTFRIRMPHEQASGKAAPRRILPALIG